MTAINLFVEEIQYSFDNKTFIKIKCSKPKSKTSDLVHIYIRTILIKNETKLSFTYKFKTNDQTKNFSINDGLAEINSLISSQFLAFSLFTSENDFNLLGNIKGTYTLIRGKATQVQPASLSHNREKIKRSESDASYLHLLGISTENGEIIPAMADKYRQINKYLEIIEAQLKDVKLPSEIKIVDMGSGKGYLTFALYDFLKNKKGLNVSITGIELREDLVSFCNKTAQECGFSSLNFVAERIENYPNTQIDILIALHACDTATDDALFKAISSNASLIICAPCCHKQVRQQVKGKEQKSPLLKYGIFKERQFEMVTDTMRALILEKNQYSTHIFEFVSNEHTRKNIMLVGTKTDSKANISQIDSKLDQIKEEYGVEYQYLEKLLS